MKYLEIDGGKLAYSDSENGKVTVMFIHGLRLSNKVWYEQKYCFERLGFRVITIDLRGHGQSKMNSRVWDFNAYIKDIVSLIKKLKLENTVIVGHSFGGMIAQILVQKYPDLFKALVLINTSCELNNAEKDGLVKKVRTIEKYKFLLRFLPTQLIGLVNYEFIHCPSYASLNSLKHSIQFKNCNNVYKISCKTLIITGSNDSTIDPVSSDILHRKISGSTLLRIENARHNIMIENKNFINSALSNFISSQ